MKTIQLQAHDYDNNDLLRAAGVRRIHPGWYTACYRGVSLDRSTICSAIRNRGGRIRTAPPTFSN
jgi:hypothetical protein